MASTLPTARDLGVVQVQPNLGVVQRRGDTGLEGAAAKGLESAASGFGQAAAYLEKAQDEFDNLQAEDRFNQYQERLNQIALDPEKGWKMAKGENAIKPEFIRDYSEKFEEERKKFVDTLGTPNAKQRFNRLAQAATLKSRGDLYAHSAQERVAYGAKVFDDSIKLIKDNAWRAHGNDELFNSEMARAKALTEQFARQWFVGADEKSIQRAVQETESAMWKARVEGALDAGNAKLAKELFGKASGSLTTADVGKLSPRIKAHLKVSEAVEVVDDVFSKHVSQDPNAPYPATKIDEELRKRFADNPESLQAARQEADYRARKIQETQRENSHANIAASMDNFYLKKMPLSQIMQTKEFQAMDGRQRAEFINSANNFMHLQEARALTAEDRSLARERRAALAQHRAGQQVVGLYMMDPDTLAGMSDNAIKSLMPQIGVDNVLALQQAKAQLTKIIGKPMSREEFRPILSEYVPESKLKSVFGPGAKTNEQAALRAQYGLALGRINQAIQERSTKERRELTREEKEEIARKILDQKVRIDTGWSSVSDIFSFDKEMTAAMIPGTGPIREQYLQRGTIPIGEISDARMRVYLEVIKQTRPGFKDANDDRIKRELRTVLERAAALDAMNAGENELENVLRGTGK